MLLVSVYLILLFHLIVVSFSSIYGFISLCVASIRNKKSTNIHNKISMHFERRLVQRFSKKIHVFL